jgi:hypothetical protein
MVIGDSFVRRSQRTADPEMPDALIKRSTAARRTAAWL